MDPITNALVKYTEHLNEGGAPVRVMDGTKRDKVYKLHPSALGPGLCDRKACYNVLVDIGDIKVEDFAPSQQLSFRVGNIFQDFVGQALKFAGALVLTEFKVEDENFTGRLDLYVYGRKLEPAVDHCMLIDVKAVKSKSVSNPKDTFYPKPYHVAQLEMYKKLFLKEANPQLPVVPYLYIVTRLDMDSTLITWKWEGDDCHFYRFGEDRECRSPEVGLATAMQKSIDAQLEWLHGGLELPDRCGSTPDEHPFMCCDIDRAKAGWATPSCQYFELCWGSKPERFKKGEWEGTRYEVVW